jgi:coenzyme F420-reducing hydrogenase delta subunit
MCTGMVDPKYVIKSFLEGADGVLISGCNPGDCHYINGNFKARRRIKLLKGILDQFGVQPQRLRLTWIGASDGVRLAEIMREMTEQIKALRPGAAEAEDGDLNPDVSRCGGGGHGGSPASRIRTCWGRQAFSQGGSPGGSARYSRPRPP